jgi:hypothetical protein
MSRCLPVSAAGLVMAGALCLTPLGAQSDPMRPLGGGNGLKDVSSRPSAPGSTPAAPAEAAPAPPPARLVAIRLDSQGVWHALFDERWLTIGDRLGAQRIAAIDAGSVQLREGKRTRSVHLLPVLEPMPPAAAASAAPGTPVRASVRRAATPTPELPTASIARKTTP